jgi:hypothetical protein
MTDERGAGHPAPGWSAHVSSAIGDDAVRFGRPAAGAERVTGAGARPEPGA